MRLILSLVVSGLAIAGFGPHIGAARSAAGQGRSSSAREVPVFRVDPAWPKIPNNWQFGQVASVSIDAQDHVWVLLRAGTLSKEETARAAPPVL